MRLSPARLAPLFALLAACTPSDKPESGDDTATDTSVVVTWEDVFRTRDGAETTVPRAPFEDYEVIEARTEVDGVVTSWPAALDGDGRVTIADVPEGPFTLYTRAVPSDSLPGVTVGMQTFTTTSVRALSQGHVYAGRSDVSLTDQALALSLDGQGLTPIQVPFYDEETGASRDFLDLLEVHSYDADALAQIPLDPNDGGLTGAPANGDVTLSGFRFDWPSYAYSYTNAGDVLVDRNAGDDLRIVHLAQRETFDPTRTDPGAFYRWYTPVDALATGVGMVDGEPSEVSGRFEPVPTSDYTLDLRASDFAAVLEADLPGTLTSTELDVYVTQEPGAPEPIIGVGPTLLSFSVRSAQDDTGAWVHADDIAETFSLGNPYEAGDAHVSVSLVFGSSFTDPVSGTSEYTQGYVSVSAPAADYDGAPLTPLVGLPRNVRVGGVAAPTGETTTGIGSAPVVSFEAPTLGTPDAYSVIVRTLEDVTDTEGNVLSRRRDVARFNTTDTEVTLPEGLLQEGVYYTVIVQAIVGRTPESTAFGLVEGIGASTTGPFTP